jgi:hypothetical protein
VVQIAQKKCEVCGGSGLVLRDKIYVRCQGCGTSQFLLMLSIEICNSGSHCLSGLIRF